MTAILDHGIQAFRGNLDYAFSEHPAHEWRTSGRKTKAQPNGEDIEFYRANGPVWVQTYYNWRLANPHLSIHKIVNEETGEYIPAIEVAVNVQVPDSDIVLKGYIDRVFHNDNTGELLIVDLKSGKTEQPSPLQLAFYRLGWLQKFGVDIRYGAYYSARDGGLDQQYDLDQFPPEMVSRWLRNADKMIRLNLLTPNVSRDCSWCGLKPHCFVWNPDVERPEFSDDIGVSDSQEPAA